MNVVFCASEVVPFIKTGGLADVCGALPLALEKLGVNVSIILPHYKSVNSKKYKIKKFDRRISQTTIGKNIKVYLVDSKEYFHRDGLYVSGKGDYNDNLERFSYFCVQAIELLKRLNKKIDIVHCHDWQTALIPVYLKTRFKNELVFKNAKTILTIHNLAFQGLFSKAKFRKLGLDESLYKEKIFEFYGKTNLLMAGIHFCDEVTTVSPRYAKEILTKEFGCGLNDVLKLKKGNIDGILNGVDYEMWNPSKDHLLVKEYSVKDWKVGKEANKQKVQKYCELPRNNDTPMFGFVSRLSHQKGVDLIVDALEDLVKFDVQLVIQGLGEAKYCRQLKKWARKYPEKIAVHFQFNEKLAHRIYAASDFFLMPSNFEPCGLSQLISLRYGTIPIVFKTGGLVDTIKPFNQRQQTGNGFVFAHYQKEDLIKAIKRALKIYENKPARTFLVKNAIKSDFSWKKSAQKYKRVYRCV